MFTKIDIKKFGLYKGFRWMDNLPELKRLNIIYGRNYCGKTTLSRIFDSAGQGQLPKKYQDGEFTLYTDDNTVAEVTEKNLSKCPYMVRVYNSDFVRRNLSWLNNEEEGEIKPFALIGSENVEAQKAIDKLNEELGSVEEKTGLRYEYATKNAANDAALNRIAEAEQELEQNLKEKAKRDIRPNLHYVKPGATYTVANIKNDIDTISHTDELGILTIDRNFILKRQDRERLIKTVDQAIKPEIDILKIKAPNLRSYRDDVIRLVKTKITLTQTLQELVEDDLLQAWVDEGRAVNKNRKTCAFCGNPISKDRWRALRAHFSKESETLKRKLLAERERLENARSVFDGCLESHYFTAQNIYVTYIDKYEKAKSRWDAYVEEYQERIDELIDLIDERLKNIFVPINIKNRRLDENDPTKFRVVGKSKIELLPILQEINAVIKRNNGYTARLDLDKEQARNKLRLDYVCSYCIDINYIVEKSRLQAERANMLISASIIGDLRQRINQTEAMIAQKELEKKDESLAAKRVTSLLANHFGNGSLSLEPEVVKEDSIRSLVASVVPEMGHEPPRTRFVVKRGGKYANNLSEGERSLIAFCYFITQIDNELKGPDADKLVIFIDDPISSLDSNHIFFMYSLIDAVIAEPRKYGQLFISTHNLEFLKFLKRIDLPGAWGRKDISHYVVVKSRKGDTDDYRSEILDMPSYLKDYVTEYNFLFKQVYEIARPVKGDKQALYGNKYSQYYNIGNNMRKFLECYLFYRYPDTDDPIKKHMKQLFDGHVPSEVNRVVNEYSHLVWAERGLRVVDVPEIEKVARLILNALKEKDPEHYDTLCKSVGVDEKVFF